MPTKKNPHLEEEIAAAIPHRQPAHERGGEGCASQL